MSEPLDTVIRDHIFDVFENYEDPSADAGWQLLRQRFPEKKKDRVIFWWFSSAAGLLLFTGLFLLLNKKTDTVVYHISKKTKHQVIAGSRAPQNDKKIVPYQEVKPVEKIKPLIHKDSANQLYAYNNHYPAVQTPAFVNRLAPAINGHKPAEVLTEKPVSRPILAATDNVQIGNSSNVVKYKPDTTKAVNITALNTNIPPDSKALTGKPADPVLKMMAEDNAKQPKNALTKQLPKNKSMVELSPYAATYFNYAKGSSNQVNIGAGVTTDFKISSNFKLSTGLSIAQNTLNFDNGNIPQQAAASANAYASATVALSSPNGSFVNTAYSLGNYKANLIGLDIPINFKYQFNPSKTDTYVSAGISSGTFINETYSSNILYNNSQNANPTQINNQHFGTFDFAKTVNFSFGVGYPVGTNRLIVEPFLKYPIGGLGSQNIRFGASGINFKFNFSTTKK